MEINKQSTQWTDFLQSELKALLRNGSINNWVSNDIDLGMNSQYCDG